MIKRFKILFKYLNNDQRGGDSRAKYIEIIIDKCKENLIKINLTDSIKKLEEFSVLLPLTEYTGDFDITDKIIESISLKTGEKEKLIYKEFLDVYKELKDAHAQYKINKKNYDEFFKPWTVTELSAIILLYLILFIVVVNITCISVTRCPSAFKCMELFSSK